MIRFLCAVIMGLYATSVTAQQVQDCDWIARADAIVEPWKDNTRTFANGNVRLALLDTVEPAAAAFHILVLSPPYGELGERQCKTIGVQQNIGFPGVDFKSLEAAYHPSIGLVFELKLQVFDGSNFDPGQLQFSLNQSTGEIVIFDQ